MQIIYILITLLILSVLILVHEFGHYITARMTGVRVLEFSLGMGPALFKYERGGTLYAIRALPLGGYCSLYGENEEEIIEDDPESSFLYKPARVRFLIFIAGVTMNFIAAYVFIFIAALLSGRDFLTSITFSFSILIKIFTLIFLSLKMLFTGEAGLNDLAGPIGMVGLVGEYYQYGLIYLLLFTAMLSVNLGVLNLLPIPALDGGQILILIIEKIKRGKISEKLKERLFLTSYALLMALAIIVAFSDIGRIIH